MFGSGYGYKHIETESHPIGETLDIMNDLVKAGKIRHIGLSNETPWGTMSFLKGGSWKRTVRTVDPERL